VWTLCQADGRRENQAILRTGLLYRVLVRLYLAFGSPPGNACALFKDTPLQEEVQF
jgi:hypothetical protein